MKHEKDIRKVDGPIAMLLQKFKGVSVQRFKVILPSGKDGEIDLPKSIHLDELGAMFYRRGADLKVVKGVLTWKHEGYFWTPILENKKQGIKSTEKVEEFESKSNKKRPGPRHKH